ncbi:MAG: MFS transporter [Acidimicrobiia bacterium]
MHEESESRREQITGGSRLRHAVRALRHRDFALFWTGALISNAGTWMQNVTVPFVLLRVTGSPTWVGFGTFAQFIPAVVLGPVGGRLADRFRRKRVVIVTQFGGMFVALALWWVWRGGSAGPGVTVALVSLLGVTIGLGLPSWQSFVPELVPRHDLLNAVTLNSAQFNMARAIGPTVGGAVLAAFGPAQAFLGNALSFGAVLLALALMHAGRTRTSPPSTDEGTGTFREGVEYLRRHTGLVLAVGMIAVVVFLGNPVIPLSAVFAQDVFGVGALAYGFMTAALGVGAVGMAFWIGAYGDAFPRSRLAVSGICVYGTGVLLMGVSPIYAVTLPAMTLLGAGYITIASSLNTSIQLQVADRFRGRVLAIYFMTITGAFPVGALVQGAIADAVGVRWTVAPSGALIVTFSLWLMTRTGLTSSLDEHRHRPGYPPPTEAAPSTPGILR